MSAGSGGGNLGSAVGFVALDVSRLSRGVAEGTRQLNQLERAGDASGRNFQKIGLAAAGIGAGLSLALGTAVKTFASFDHQITGVAASLGGVGTSAGITEDQFNRLREAALQVGVDTSLSASEAAAAFDVLAKAGVSAEDIITGVGKASANLAEAIGEGIAPAAEAVSAALNTFNLSAADAADITDTLTAAINSSATDLTDFMAGFRNLAPIAAATGISFEEVAGSIAYFTQFGLKGADVGVSLARALERLSNPTKEAAEEMRRLGISAFDAQGEFIGFPALMDQLNRALGSASDEARGAALSIIFGAEAADVMTIGVQKAGDGLREMTGQMEPAGQAAEQAAQRMDSLQGALERMQGSIETALIGLGGALAPTIEQLAGTVEGAANAFSALPGPMQQVAAGSLAAAAGLALAVAAIAQTGSIASSTAARLASFARSAALARAAAAGLLLAINPVTIAIAAVGAVVFQAIQSYRDHAAAVRELETAFRELNEAVNAAKLGGDIALTESLTALEVRLKAIEAASEGADEAWVNFIDNAPKIGEMVDDLHGGTIEIQNLAAILDEGTLSLEEMARVTELSTRAVNTQGIEVAKVEGIINGALDAYQLFIDTQGRLGLSGDAVLAIIEDLNTNIGDYAIEAERAGKSTTAFADAKNEARKAANELVEAEEELIESTKELADETLEGIAGMEDWAPTLDGVQGGFIKTGESVGKALLAMDDLGSISLDPAIREALELQGALQDVEADILRVESAIAENAEDMSMWQGRIDLVNETLGTEENHLEHLDQLLADNKISQEEYNEIKEAGAFIVERSTGALEDERLEQARQLPILAEYIRMHDDADGAVRNLTDAQKGFLAAMQSSQGQTALQTLQLLAYLAALGLVPPEVVTNFIADASAADPIVAALFKDLGLIPPEKDVKIVATRDGTAIEDTHKALDDLPPEKNIAIHVQTVQQGDLTGGPDVQATVEIPTAFGTPDASAIVGPTTPVEIPTELQQPDPIDVAKMDPVQVPIEISDEGVATALGEIDTALTTIDRTVTPVVDVSTDVPISRLQAVLDKLDDIDVATATPLVSLAAGAGGAALGITTDLQNVLDQLTALDDASAEAEVTADYAAFTIAMGVVQGVADTWDESGYDATITADYSAFSLAMSVVQGIADTWDEDTFTSETATDYAAFSRAMSVVQGIADTWDRATFTSDIDANNAGAFGALNSILLAVGLSWSGRVFHASLSLDTSGAIGAAANAVAVIASMLPSSPAEIGPLSKEPSFAYIPEAFAVAMDDMVGIAERRLSDVDRAFMDHQRSLAMASLIDADGPLSFGRALSPATIPAFDRSAAQGGNTYITQQLAPEALLKLMTNAKKGGSLYDATASELTIRRR